MFSSKQIVTDLSPIPALTCPDTAGLGLLSSHSCAYGFTPGILPSTPAGPWRLRVYVQNRSRRFCQSSPAPSRICPASALGMLVQYPGYEHE